MNEPDAAREEEHYRQAERAMLFAEDAAKRITAIASDLRTADAANHLADSLEQAADAIRSAHREMVKTVYWKAPE